MSENPVKLMNTRSWKNKKTNSSTRKCVKGRRQPTKSKTLKPNASVPHLIARKIQAVIHSYPSGLELEKFSHAFMRRIGHPLYPEDHGFTDLVELLQTLNTILKIENHGNGKVLIKGVKEGEVRAERNVDGNGEQLFIDPSPSASLCPETLETFRDILKKHSNGILLDDLPHLYQISCGKKLDVESIGFASLLDLASQLSDVFNVHTSNYQEYFLYDAEIDPGPVLKDLKLQHKKAEIEKTKRKFSPATIERLTRLLEEDFPGGLSIEEVVGAYRGLYGAGLTDLECTQYGYLSLQALLMAHPEVVNLHHIGGVVTVQAASVTLQEATGQQREEEPTVCQIFDTGGLNKTVSTSEHYQTIDSGTLEPSEVIDVVVAEVFSPSKFWIILRGEETSKDLDELMDKMFEFYSSPVGNRFKVPPAVPHGAPVVSLFEEDQNYYRALIVSIEDLKTVKLFFVDFGTVCQADVACLRLLHEKFFRLPAQAIKASLFGIEPVEEKKKWPKETSVAFLNLVQNRPFVCCINDIKNHVLFVSLWNTENDVDINIADVLVERKLAKYKDDSCSVSDCQKKVIEHKEECRTCNTSQCFHDRSLPFCLDSISALGHETVIEEPSDGKVASEICPSTKNNAGLSPSSFDYISSTLLSESLSYAQQKEVIKVLQNKLREAYELLQHSHPHTHKEISSRHMVEKNGNMTSSPKVSDQRLERTTLASFYEYFEGCTSGKLFSSVEDEALANDKCHVDEIGFPEHSQTGEVKAPGTLAKGVSGCDSKLEASQCFKEQSELNLLMSSPTREEHLCRNPEEFISNCSVIPSASCKSLHMNATSGTKIQVKDGDSGGENALIQQELNHDMMHCTVLDQDGECLDGELVNINEEEHSLPASHTGQSEMGFTIEKEFEVREDACIAKNAERVIGKRVGEELEGLISNSESDFQTNLAYISKDEHSSIWPVSRKMSENGLEQDQYILKEEGTNQQAASYGNVVHEIVLEPQQYSRVQLLKTGSNSTLELHSESLPLKNHVSIEKADMEQSCRGSVSKTEIDYTETRGASTYSIIEESIPRNCLTDSQIMAEGTHFNELGFIESYLPHDVIISDPHNTTFNHRNEMSEKSNSITCNLALGKQEEDLIIFLAEPRVTEELEVKASTNDFKNETKSVKSDTETHEFSSLTYDIPIKESYGCTKKNDFVLECIRGCDKPVQNKVSLIDTVKTQNKHSCQNLSEFDNNFAVETRSDSFPDQKVASLGYKTASRSLNSPRLCFPKQKNTENEIFVLHPNSVSECLSQNSSECHQDGHHKKSHEYGFNLECPSQTSSGNHQDRHEKCHEFGGEEIMYGKDQGIVMMKADSLICSDEEVVLATLTHQECKFDPEHTHKSNPAEEQPSETETSNFQNMNTNNFELFNVPLQGLNEELAGLHASLDHGQKPVKCRLTKSSISQIECSAVKNSTSKSCMNELNLPTDIKQRKKFFQEPVECDAVENLYTSKTFMNRLDLPVDTEQRKNLYPENFVTSVYRDESWVDSNLKYLYHKMKLTASRVHWKKKQFVLPQLNDPAKDGWKSVTSPKRLNVKIDKSYKFMESLEVTNENHKGTLKKNEMPMYCTSEKVFAKDFDETSKASRFNKRNILGTLTTDSFGQQGFSVTTPAQTSCSSNKCHKIKPSQVPYVPPVIPQWWQWPSSSLYPVYAPQNTINPALSIKPPSTFSFESTGPNIQGWSKLSPEQNSLVYLTSPHVSCGVCNPFDQSVPQLGCPIVTLYPGMYMMTPPSVNRF